MLKGYSVIFGGAFDPPHVGHQAIINWLISALDAREVIVCPTYEHCFGKKLLDFKARFNMCARAFRDMPDGGVNNRVKIHNIEEHLPTPNMTANLLKYFKGVERREKLAVVIGADNFKQIHNWNRWDEVISMAKIVVVGRPGFDMEEKYNFDCAVYPVGISTVSSTEIRTRIAEGKSLEGFVPSVVKKIIVQNNYYYGK